MSTMERYMTISFDVEAVNMQTKPKTSSQFKTNFQRQFWGQMEVVFY